MAGTPCDDPKQSATDPPRPAGLAPDGPHQRGDVDIRIGRDGRWFYHGSPIGRKPLVKLFASVLRRDEAGDYWLQTPVEKARIRVDDAPFVAVALAVEGDGREQRLVFRSNLDDVVCADADHPIRIAHDARTGEPAPYVTVRPGLEALIARSVFYQLVDLADQCPESHILGVWSAGIWFPLGSAGEAT